MQGVGFRPFVYRLARELRARAATCSTTQHGRAARGRGRAAARRSAFLARLRARGAAAGRCSSASAAERLPPTGERGFRILAEPAGGDRRRCRSRPTPPPAPTAWPSCSTPATAATATRSSTAPTAARGSRSSRGVPYDRPLTTMAAFAMCAACRREYEDPADRRFHAQPNACPACGPRAVAARSRAASSGAPSAIDALRRRGRGAADGRDRRGQGPRRLPPRRATPTTRTAVAALRARKHREDKPFALMVADLPSAARAGRARPRRGAAAASRRSGRSCSRRAGRGAAVAGAGRARRRPSSA